MKFKQDIPAEDVNLETPKRDEKKIGKLFLHQLNRYGLKMGVIDEGLFKKIEDDIENDLV